MLVALPVTLVTMLAGQLTVGAGAVTITLKLQVPVLPAASVAVQFTVLVPTLKDVPEAGMQTTEVGPWQVPVAVGVV